MVQENKKEGKNIEKKVVESFEDFANFSFKDMVSFSDGREEVVVQNHSNKGKCITCREIGEGKNKKIRKNIYLQEKGSEPAHYRDFDFNKNSSDFEKGQYAHLGLILDSYYNNL